MPSLQAASPMSPRHFEATINHFATRLAAEHTALAQAWLERLDALLEVDRRDVFPTHQLLDHIPELLREIADYLRRPFEGEIVANTAVMAKATELGVLRFDQRASVHQLLREYQFLGEIIESFFAREAAQLGERADATAAILALSRAQQAVRELQRRTVDAFIARYADTIERQHGQLLSFGRLVSHEIRQPLGVLQVLTRLLHTTDDGPGRSKLVDTLERNVVRMGEVAGKLERLARLTRRADNVLNDQTVDLSALSRDVAEQLDDLADVRGVSFEIADDLPVLSADAGRVELVLINLLANAVKYSDPAKDARHVKVVMDTTAEEPQLRIEDNGIGIPAAQFSLIFEQFVRVHAHRDDELGSQGLGLGLSIVRECMEAMGGAVTVESVEGQGTAFVLRWPAEAWAA